MYFSFMAPNSIKFDAKYISNILLTHPCLTSFNQIIKALKVGYLNDNSCVRVTLCKSIRKVIQTNNIQTKKTKSTFVSLGGGPGCALPGRGT